MSARSADWSWQRVEAEPQPVPVGRERVQDELDRGGAVVAANQDGRVVGVENEAAFVGAEPGLGTDTQMNMVIALHDYVVGFVHREHAILRLIRRSGLDTADWSRQVGHYLTRTTNDPIFADRIAQLASHHGHDTFEFGLQSLLDGFATRLASAG